MSMKNDNAFYVDFKGSDRDEQPRNLAKGFGQYLMTPEIETYADDVINNYHPHLRDASIGYLLRRGNWRSRGSVVTGRAIVSPDHWRLLTGYDLVLMINETVWQSLGEKGRDVLLDHELAHFTPPVTDKSGKLKWGTRDHDLREFSEVVKRHGVCLSDHKVFVEAAGQMNIESLSSLSVFSPEEDMYGLDDEEDDNCFLSD